MGGQLNEGRHVFDPIVCSQLLPQLNGFGWQVQKT
jgi:hypothetical protein